MNSLLTWNEIISIGSLPKDRPFLIVMDGVISLMHYDEESASFFYATAPGQHMALLELSIAHRQKLELWCDIPSVNSIERNKK